MRFGMRSRLVAATALALVWSMPARAGDIPIPGKIAIVKDGKLFKLVARPGAMFTIPEMGGASDPTINPSSVKAFDTNASGSLSDSLLGGAWQGLGNPAGGSGYKYKNSLAPIGGAVKLIILKPSVIKILANDDGTLNGPIVGNLGIELNTGSDRRCAEFGGTNIKNVAGLWKEKDAPAPGSCRLIGPT